MATLIDIAQGRGSFTRWLHALRAAGLEPALAGGRRFTLFAPTDRAFSELPQPVLEVVLNDPPTLREVLSYHLVPGIVFADELIRRPALETLHGDALPVEAMDGIRVGEARVIQADLVAENGVLHAVDRVLLPNARRIFTANLSLPAEPARRESLLI